MVVWSFVVRNRPVTLVRYTPFDAINLTMCVLWFLFVFVQIRYLTIYYFNHVLVLLMKQCLIRMKFLYKMQSSFIHLFIALCLSLFSSQQSLFVQTKTKCIEKSIRLIIKELKTKEFTFERAHACARTQKYFNDNISIWFHQSHATICYNVRYVRFFMKIIILNKSQIVMHQCAHWFNSQFTLDRIYHSDSLFFFFCINIYF